MENVIPFPVAKYALASLQFGNEAAVRQACCAHVQLVLTDVARGKAGFEEASENLQMLVAGLLDQIKDSSEK